ncbi:MAG: hypothetical protein RL701_6804, partial [Pseudomonadota bacterium]
MKSLVLVLAGLILGACVQSPDRAASSASGAGVGGHSAVCDDRDHDGFGEGCELGGDCDDTDKDVHTECPRCAYPQQGCACDPGIKPISCYLTPNATDEGTVMCHEGTRYCRSAKWSGCEAVVTYPRPVEVEQQAVISPDATVTHCTDCSVNCYVIRDNLDPVDAGVDGSIGSNSNITNITVPPTGGLTLKYTLPDAAMPDSGIVYDPSL